MSRISDASLQELNNKADAVSVIGEYVRLEKKGNRYWGLCPFHNEKTPSFSVDPEKKFFYCFGCNKGGGLLSFIMEMEKLSFPEAAESMAKSLGLILNYEGGTGVSQSNDSKDRQEQVLELYQRVAGSFHHILLATEAGKFARDYLEKRGISQDMIQKFRLGYAPADRFWLHRFLEKRAYSKDFLASSGLFSRKNPRVAFFFDRLMFPIADRRGKTVAFGARLLHGEGPKYLNSSESDLYKKRETLFAIDLALPDLRRTKEAYICEGYMDVIALHQAGINNAVAPLGTAFTAEQAALLHRWIEKAYLIFDADEAGKQAAVKAILTCKNTALSCSVVELGGGTEKDPADILRDGGPKALQNSVKCFINDFDYLVGRARSLFDITNAEGLAKATSFLFPYLDTLGSEVSRDVGLGAIADAFNVDRQSVRRDYLNRHTPVRNKPTAMGLRHSEIRMNDEIFLLIAVIVNRGLYTKLRASLSVEEVDDPRAKDLFIALEECFRNDSEDFDSLLSRIQDESLKSFVIEKSASDAFTVQADKLVMDGITRIKVKRLERRRAEIVLALRTAKNEGTGTERALDDLLSEKVHVDTELLRLKEDYE